MLEVLVDFSVVFVPEVPAAESVPVVDADPLLESSELELGLELEVMVGIGSLDGLIVPV